MERGARRFVIAIAVIFAIAIAIAGATHASVADAARRHAAATSATSSTLTIRWNGELLRRYGLAVDGVRGDGLVARAYPIDGRDATPLRDGDTSAPRVITIVDGPAIRVRGAAIALRRARVSSDATRWSLHDDDGVAWFEVSHAMPLADAGSPRLELRTADLRLSPAMAERLGDASLAGVAVGEAHAWLPRAWLAGPDLPRECGAPNWHGLPAPGGGGTYTNDVLLSSLAGQFMRCAGCDGAGNADGTMIITPSTTLSNNVNRGTPRETVPGDPLGTSAVLWTADVPWHEKFTGAFAPHGNDQHPYLIWNLYRLDADGAITQIGRSALKHAFATANIGPECDACNGGHVLGRACADPYGLGSNDFASALSPRSEVIPSRGLWGRCGSTRDPDCDGVENAPALGLYDWRMAVRESQVDPAANPGARWFLEAWYVVRDDAAIFNTMGTRPLGFSWHFNSQTWIVANDAAFRLGSVLDRWLEVALPDTSSRDGLLTTPEGRARAAVRVRALGDGRWRYEFAVMNFDFSRPVTSGSGDALRVLRNLGFDRFTVPLHAGATVIDAGFADGDALAANDWTGTVDADGVTWQAPAGAGLDWGTMLRFTIVADRAPSDGVVTLHVAEPGTPVEYALSSFAVGSSALFADGYE